jgi:indolepyruvate ferredoxin oxidoreductase beta subunit
LGFEPVECLRVADLLRPDCTAIINTRPVFPSSVNLGITSYPSIEEITALLQELVESIITLDALELARKAGDTMMVNIVMVGALAGAGGTPIRKDSLIQAIREAVPKGTEENNLEAFNLGFHNVRERIAK